MEDEVKPIHSIRNAPAMLRNVEQIKDKSIACTLIGAHTACDYLRRGIVKHSHDRRKVSNVTNKYIYYVIPSHECPTCSCHCECHAPEANDGN
jgi:hypothetical protein